MLFYLCLVRLDGVDARHDETWLRQRVAPKLEYGHQQLHAGVGR